MRTYIYLHGWASAPNSSKAVFFQQQFAAYNINLIIPDLNQDDFYNLTLSRQIAQVADLIHPNDIVTLIGSSFGGLTALWLAERYPQVKRLILMAPALEFNENIEATFSHDKLKQWQINGKATLMHYAWQREVEISYDFIRDMRNYSDRQLIRCVPTLILHGKNDQIVPLSSSQHFAAQRDWVTLNVYDSDHSLGDVVDELWTAMAIFCELE
jgi:uncharacterized protein